MTTENFLLALGVGSALIAFWLAVRFPDRAPGDFRRALVHVGAAIACGWLAGEAFALIAREGFPIALGSVFVIVLPVLVYTFLSGAWFLMLAHETFARR